MCARLGGPVMYRWEVDRQVPTGPSSTQTQPTTVSTDYIYTVTAGDAVGPYGCPNETICLVRHGADAVYSSAALVIHAAS